jgi:hypothetical protein
VNVRREGLTSTVKTGLPHCGQAIVEKSEAGGKVLTVQADTGAVIGFYQTMTTVVFISLAFNSV